MGVRPLTPQVVPCTTSARKPADRLRVALIGAHQRFLRRQPQAGQQLADRGKAELDAKLVGDQLGNHVARPQAKIKTVLTRIPAVDPTKYSPRLLYCQFRRTARALPRAQGTQASPPTPRPVQPFVNRGATEAVGGNDGAGILALRHPLNGHPPDLLQRLVIKCPAVPNHDSEYTKLS